MPSLYESAGAILSTVEDLYKFSMASFGDMPAYLLTQKSTAKIGGTGDIGLGWFIAQKPIPNQNVRFYFHDGATEGYTSMIVLDRENQNGIIVLSNLPDDDKSDKVPDLGLELMIQMYK